MKKPVFLLLSLTMVISLSSCGEAGGGYTEIGDSVASGNVEFVLRRPNMDDYTYFGQIKPPNGILTAVDNTGAKPRETIRAASDETVFLYGYIEFDYYRFLFTDTNINSIFSKDPKSCYVAVLSLKSVIPVKEYVGYIAVPRGITQDPGVHILFHVYLRNESGGFTPFTYKIA